MIASVKAGRAEELVESLNQGMNVNTVDADSRSLLMLAIVEGHSTLATLLMDHGADLRAVDKDGDSVISLASAAGQLQVVAALLDRTEPGFFAKLFGARSEANAVNARTGEGPLLAACALGHLEIARTLLDHGADIGHAEIGDGATALHAACMAGQTEIALLLLDRGADGSQGNKQGQTPLMFAVRNGHGETVGAVAKHARTDLSITDPLCGLNALMWAIREARTDIAKLLLESGADPNSVQMLMGTPGEPALVLASKLASVEVVAALLDKGADIEATDSEEDGGLGLSALDHAMVAHKAEKVALLKSRGAKAHISKVRKVQSQMAASLMMAALQGNLMLLHSALREGADVSHLVRTCGWCPTRHETLACELGQPVWPSSCVIRPSR